MEGQEVTIAVAGRPFPGESVSGDACWSERADGLWRIAMIDGLGHGPLAAEAAVVAREALGSSLDLGIRQSIEHCHRRLAGTRGAVIALAFIDLSAGRLTYSSIGNVEGRLWRVEREDRLLAYRGVLGATIPSVRSSEYALTGDWLLLMHTDGVRPGFQLGLLLGAGPLDPQALADSILQGWGRATDDATVLVACPTVPRPRPNGAS